MLHVVEVGQGWPQVRQCDGEQLRIGVVCVGRPSCLVTLDDALGLDRCGLWLGCVEGFTSTSLVAKIDGVDDMRDRMGVVSGREKREGERREKKGEREKAMGFSQVFEFPSSNLYSFKISRTKIYFRVFLVVFSIIN